MAEKKFKQVELLPDHILHKWVVIESKTIKHVWLMVLSFFLPSSAHLLPLLKPWALPHWFSFSNGDILYKQPTYRWTSANKIAGDIKTGIDQEFSKVLQMWKGGNAINCEATWDVKVNAVLILYFFNTPTFLHTYSPRVPDNKNLHFPIQRRGLGYSWSSWILRPCCQQLL